MGSLRDIKARMKAVRNTQQITKAMKMVAAAKIKKAEARTKAARPYTEKMRDLVSSASAGFLQGDEERHPLYQERPVSRVGILLISADRGLCGSYNHNLVRLAVQFFKALPEEVIPELFIVGKKAEQHSSRRGYRIRRVFQVSSYPEFHEARKIAATLSEAFLHGACDEVWCLYTRFISAMSQKPHQMRLLPLEQKGDAQKGTLLFEPDPSTLLNALVPQYVAVQVYQILLESRAAELGARLVAMGNATENAQKLIDSLTISFYRARQEAITKEILEVAGGAEALKG